MTLGEAYKSYRSSHSSPVLYRPLPLWPIIPARLTQRLLVVIEDLGQQGLHYGLGLWSSGKYRMGRINRMSPTEKARYGDSLSRFFGTHQAEVEAVRAVHAAGGCLALLQRLRDSIGISWSPSYLPGGAGEVVAAPQVAECFVEKGDWPNRSRLRNCVINRGEWMG